MPADRRSGTAPLIVAHRGASADAPENTLPAFRLAWEQEADAIEGDFHLSRDHAIVCLHDASTRRYGGRTRKIRKTRLGDLRQFDAGSWKGEQWAGLQFPTLEEILPLVPPGKRLYLEIKSSARILRHLFDKVENAAFDPAQLVIISFSSRVIRKLKRSRPRWKALWLTETDVSARDGTSTPSAAKVLAKLARNGADGVSVFAHPKLDPSFAQAIKAAGREFHVWTVDDAEEARRWAALGADSITTNRPAFIRGAL